MATIKDFFAKTGVQAVTTAQLGIGSSNYVQISGAASASPVTFSALGVDADISINFIPKGTGTLLMNGSPIGVPGGSSGDIQYNNAGAFGGIGSSGTGNVVRVTSAGLTTPTIAGGTHTGLTSLGIRNTGTGVFDLTLAHNGTMTAGRTLTFNVNDVSRTVSLGGNITTAGDLVTAGAFSLTLTQTGATNVTLPTTGTLATLNGTETFTLKTLTTPQINGGTISVAATVTAGTNAQGQGPLTSDHNVVTTAAANPSGITLPTATTGRSIRIVNKGANPINVYPAVGGAIDALATNAAISIPVNGYMMFHASSVTQWYSSINGIVNGSAVIGTISGSAASLSPGANINGTLFTGSGNITITANTTNSLTINSGGAGGASPQTFNGGSAITISYNTVGAPSTTGTNATGTWAISISGTATNATNTAITDDTTTNATMYPTWVTTTTGNLPQKVSSTKLSFNPSTGVLSSTSFTGAGTGLTGTAAALSIGGTAASATTAGSVTNAVTFNNGGAGDASGTTFNGSVARTISHNTVGAVALAGSTMTGALTLSADPVSAMHAATKQYVDAVKSGLDIKDSVRAASAAALTATYSNGASGVGATLTNSGTQAAFATDGVTMALNERVLIKDQASAFQNGIYTVTTVGSGASNWVLTRATDADTTVEVSGGMFTFVEEGSTNADSGWVCTADGVVTMGTTLLPFSQFSGAGTIAAGNGIVKVGSTIHFQSSGGYAVGDLFYADTTTTVARLADIATGNAIISGGVGVAPSFGKIALDTSGVSHVSGVLQVANGGTGAATLTGYVKGAGTADMTASATIPGADITGNITGNAANVTGIVATANGGTGANLTLTQYGVIVANATTTMTSTAIGTAKQVLAANTSATPTFQTLDMTYIPDAIFKKSVRVASTAQQALSGGTAFPTIDAVTVAAGDRVLLKNQTLPQENGIYLVGGTAGAWTFTRVTDGDLNSEMGEAVVAVDAGTAGGGRMFRTNFKAGDTLGTTTMPWYEILDTSHIGNASYVPSPTGTGASGTWGISISGLAATATSATSATNATNFGVTNDTTTNATMFPVWVTANTGNLPARVTSTKLSYNPSTGILTSTGGFAGTATAASTVTIVDDTTTNATMYPTWVTTTTGNLPAKVTSSKLTFNPSTGVLSATTFSGAFTGTATNATNIGITDDTTTNATMYPVWVTANTGNLPAKVTSTKMSFNPSTGVLTASGFTTTGNTTTGTLLYGGNAAITTGSAAVTTTSATNVDAWSSVTYRSARYTVQIVDGTNYETADMLIIHDGTTPYVTTFGNVFTSTNSLGAFDASIAGGTVTVTYTAVGATSKTVKFIRQLMTV